MIETCYCLALFPLTNLIQVEFAFFSLNYIACIASRNSMQLIQFQLDHNNQLLQSKLMWISVFFDWHYWVAVWTQKWVQPSLPHFKSWCICILAWIGLKPHHPTYLTSCYRKAKAEPKLKICVWQFALFWSELFCEWKWGFNITMEPSICCLLDFEVRMLVFIACVQTFLLTLVQW